MDLDAGADVGPAVEPLGEVHRFVDAAVAHDGAEVLVPVGTVEGMADIGKVHHPGDGRDVVVLAADDAFHVVRFGFGVDVKGAGRRVEAGAAGANVGGVDGDVALPGGQVLLAEIDFDPVLAAVTDARLR